MKRTAIVGTTRMGIANANAKTTTAWTTSMSFRGSVLDRSHITGSLRFAVPPRSLSANSRSGRR